MRLPENKDDSHKLWSIAKLNSYWFVDLKSVRNSLYAFTENLIDLFIKMASLVSRYFIICKHIFMYAGKCS